MIPLNKPGDLEAFSFIPSSEFASIAANSRKSWLFTAGDGLNLIYQMLYQEYGSLRVAVSPLTCFQAIYPIVMNGHTPVLVDIDKDSLNIDFQKIPKDVDAIEIIHLGGCPVEMDSIMTMGKIIIEDCAQAMGAKWNGRYVGTFGDYSVYSVLKNLYLPAGLVFGVDAMICTKEVSSAVNIYKNVKIWLEKRASYPSSIVNCIYGRLLQLRAKEGGFKNVVRGVGNIGRLEDSLKYIEELNRKRIENAFRIIATIDSSQFIIQKAPTGGLSIWNRILMRSIARPAHEIITILRSHGIAANNLTQSYIRPWQEPIWHDEMLYHFYCDKNLPMYNEVVGQVVAIPNSPFLNEQEVEHICSTLKKLR